MKKVSQPIYAPIGARFSWIIGVIDSGYIQIQNIFLKKGIYNKRLRIQNGYWIYMINKKHISPCYSYSLHCKYKKN